jgi:hypothetical protein
MAAKDLPSSPALGTSAAPTASGPAAVAPGQADAHADDPPATTMANLFRQKASPIRFFLVILIWAIGVLIVAVDTKRRTAPRPAEPAPASSPSNAAARPPG